MELVVKPTKRCNFDCTFCCTPPTDKFPDLTSADIIKFLEHYPDTNTIIINGGDPFMMPPKFYLEIIDYIKNNNLKCSLSLSSNLWGFYQNPDKWLPILKQTDVLKVSTSFQFGQGRRISASRPFTEELFIKVVTKFKELVGYTPFFIAVISEENEDTVIKTVKLAKRLGTTCRINPAMKSGRHGKPYPLYKILKHYLKIIELGYDTVDFSSQQLKHFSTGQTACPMPYHKLCDENIRSMSPGLKYHSCSAFNDDYIDDEGKYDIDFDAEMQGQIFHPLKRDPTLLSLKSECLSCELFKLCNGCYKYIKDAKSEGSNFVEDHCANMKALQPELQLYL